MAPYLVARPRARLPRAAVAECAMECQVAIREVPTADLWGAAFRVGDPALMAACHRLDAYLRAALGEARSIAGLAEPPDVPVERAA